VLTGTQASKSSCDGMLKSICVLVRRHMAQRLKLLCVAGIGFLIKLQD